VALTSMLSAGSKVRAAILTAFLNERMPVTARKTSNETVNGSAALQDDNELFVAVEASCVYHLELRISYTSGTTPDLKIGWTYPTGTTIRWSGTDSDTAGALRIAGNLTETSVPAICGSGTDINADYTGVIITGVNAGTLTLQWAQNTSTGSNSTIYAGSFLTIKRVA
jgi:hypothetical protein